MPSRSHPLVDQDDVLSVSSRRCRKRWGGYAGPISSVFRQVAHAREVGWGTDILRFHLRERASRANEELATQIADAPAPFWRHVRDALAERHP